MRDTRQRPGKQERAVSEIIGYILVFALIITSVGLVSIGGIPSFDSARESEQLQNADRAFDVLDTNMVEIYDRGAPSRSTELNAGDAVVETRESVTFNITVTYKDGNVSATEAAVNPIVFSGVGDTEFVYVAGAIIRDQPDANVLRSEPPFKINDKRAVFTLVETTSDGRQSTEGGTVLVRAESVRRSVEVADISGSRIDEITISVSDSPRQEVWERYFEEELGMAECSNDADICYEETNLDGMQTFVTVQEIEINLEI